MFGAQAASGSNMIVGHCSRLYVIVSDNVIALTIGHPSVVEGGCVSGELH